MAPYDSMICIIGNDEPVCAHAHVEIYSDLRMLISTGENLMMSAQPSAGELTEVEASIC